MAVYLSHCKINGGFEVLLQSPASLPLVVTSNLSQVPDPDFHVRTGPLDIRQASGTASRFDAVPPHLDQPRDVKSSLLLSEALMKR